MRALRKAVTMATSLFLNIINAVLVCVHQCFLFCFGFYAEKTFFEDVSFFYFSFCSHFLFYLSHASFDGAMSNRKTAKQNKGFKGETSEFENGSDAQGCFFATSYGPLVFFYLLLSFSTK